METRGSTPPPRSARSAAAWRAHRARARSCRRTARSHRTRRSSSTARSSTARRARAAPSRTRQRRRRCDAMSTTSRSHSSRRRTGRGTQATRSHASRDAARSPRSSIDALRERHREDAPLVDALRTLAEARALDQLVHLALRAAPHHPRLATAVAGERARDQLELRMPRLARVDQHPAGRDRIGEPRERLRDAVVVGEQLVESGDDADRRPRRDRREACTIERIALLEPRDLGEPPRLAQRAHRLAEQLLHVQLALPDAAPADRIEIVAIDEATERAASCCRVAINVIERAAGIEAGGVAEPYPLGNEPAEAQAGACRCP